jgi:hypothetical protein
MVDTSLAATDESLPTRTTDLTEPNRTDSPGLNPWQLRDALRPRVPLVRGSGATGSIPSTPYWRRIIRCRSCGCRCLQLTAWRPRWCPGYKLRAEPDLPGLDDFLGICACLTIRARPFCPCCSPSAGRCHRGCRRRWVALGRHSGRWCVARRARCRRLLRLRAQDADDEAVCARRRLRRGSSSRRCILGLGSRTAAR